MIILDGKASTKAKNKYNAKAYDQIPVRVPKGKKEIIKTYAESKGKSLKSATLPARL